MAYFLPFTEAKSQKYLFSEKVLKFYEILLNHYSKRGENLMIYIFGMKYDKRPRQSWINRPDKMEISKALNQPTFNKISQSPEQP